MKTPTRHNFAILTTTLVAFLAASSPSEAANITWGAAQNIAGDNDVSTSGTLVAAFNVGDGAFTGTPGYGSVAGTTVNGVTFNPFVVNSAAGLVSNVTVGNFTLATGDAFLSNNAAYGATVTPFSSLSANYQTLLKSATIVSNFFIDPATFTLTMAALTVGQTYQFQWWANASNGLTDIETGAPIAGSVLHSATGGINTVTLDDNTPSSTATGGPGGLGQYAIGTFTANAPSQVITFSSVGTGDQYSMINAFQLRNVTPTGSVPDTGGTFALFGLALLGLAAFSWKAATAQKV